MKRIAVLTSARYADRFIGRWIEHYGAAFGRENLYVMFDGMDQKLPLPEAGPSNWGVNVLPFEHVQYNRAKGDRIRAARASDLARELFASYDIVIGTDIDEFLVIDPAHKTPLAHYLSERDLPPSLSAIGLDVARNMRVEASLDWGRPFLGQRQYCLVSDRYTKASIISRPLRWGSGFHRVKRQGFEIDPNLYLFHFGSVDDQEIEARADDLERRSAGWSAHQSRRATVMGDVSNAEIYDFDDRIGSAHKELSRPRSLLALNKPRPLSSQRVVKIPERFYGLV